MKAYMKRFLAMVMVMAIFTTGCLTGFAEGTDGGRKSAGDVLTLDFSPCRLGVLFDDEAFDHMTAEQTGTRTCYRMVFPDDGQSRQVQLVWAPDSITLWIKKNLPDPSVPGR